MKHESKALDSIDKIIDLIWHEEGRLAIINRYGAYLSEEEKAQATQLITSQKANMDRLFTIYRDELLPLMHDVRRNSEAMNPLFDKLLTSAIMARQMSGEQNVTAENTVVDAIRNEEAAMADGTALVNNADVEQNSAAVEPVAGGEVAPEVASTEVVENSVPVSEGASGEAAALENASTSQFNLGDATAGGSEVVANDVPVSGGGMVGDTTTVSENPLGSPIEGAVAAGNESADAVNAPVEGGSDNSEVTLSSMEEETSSPFVLSPIDEDVEPAVTEEEAKKAEETIAEADQQLGAIDAMKTDIMASTELTEEEKTEKLEQYTRISDVAVKAILVTKAQCEKLLASRASQKALLTPNAQEVTADTSTVGNDGVVALPDLNASEGETVVALPNIGGDVPATEEKKEEGVIPAISTDAPVSDALGTTDEKVDAPVTDGIVLPMIGGDAPAGETAVAADANASEVTASDLVLEIPGAASTDSPAEAQNDLQTMIEQANALYKEGKTAEAQALFEKIGTMNKEAQGGDTAGNTAEDAAVLVKK